MNKKERKCPKCGSTEVVLGLFHESDDKPHLIYRTWRCWKCRCAVKEYYRYRLVSSERIDNYDPWDGPMSAPVTPGTLEEYKPKATLKRVPHKHVYEYYRTCSSGMSPDAGVVWEEWRCNRNGCGDIIRRNERILEQEEWWNR